MATSMPEASEEPIVVLKEVYKSFKLPHEKRSGLKQTLLQFNKRGYERQHVLNDVSFEIKRGEFFGIVGRNGSGKSTLLKLLAGIYVPDKGTVHIGGSLVPFIELGVGFNPELTGRENVFLNGALLGFNRREVEAIYDDIVEFAELSRFMDQKLKNYSSGMQVRLAFSIAIRARQDILLVDEVLAVGDIRFQNKCYKTFRELKEEGRTIIFVTHDMSAVERFCDRALVLSKGKIEGIYKPQEAATLYEEMNATTTPTKGGLSKTEKTHRWGSGEATIASIRVNGKDAGEGVTVEQGKPLELTFTFEKKTDVPVTLGLAFYDSFGINLSGPNSLDYKLSSGNAITYTVPQLSFNPGTYNVRAVVFDQNAEKEYDHLEEAATFTVTTKQHRQQHGKVNLFGTWQ